MTVKELIKKAKDHVIILRGGDIEKYEAALIKNGFGKVSWDGFMRGNYSIGTYLIEKEIPWDSTSFCMEDVDPYIHSNDKFIIIDK